MTETMGSDSTGPEPPGGRSSLHYFALVAVVIALVVIVLAIR